MKFKYILLTFILCVFSCQNFNNKLLKQDRENLKDFVNYLFREEFSYTLFGNKPVSIDVIEVKDINLYGNYLIQRSWATWNTHFEKDRYKCTLKRLTCENTNYIIVLNKKAFEEVILENIKYISELINESLCAKEIREKLLKDDIFLKKVLFDKKLLGIFLGYGKANAESFVKVGSLISFLGEKYSYPHEQKISDIDEKPLFFVNAYRNSKKFDELDFPVDKAKSELNFLVKNSRPFSLKGSDHFLDRVKVPSFKVFDETVTEIIKKEFSKTREVIIQAYEGKDFFEVTINKWMS